MIEILRASFPAKSLNLPDDFEELLWLAAERAREIEKQSNHPDVYRDIRATLYNAAANVVRIGKGVS